MTIHQQFFLQMDTSRLKWRYRVSICVALLVLVLVPQSAVAHGEGGVVQATDYPVGDYFLHVWTSPGIMRVGEVHVEAVVTTEMGVVIPDCDVAVTLTPLEPQGKSLKTEAALIDTTSGQRHEAVFQLTHAGNYQVKVKVADAGMKMGETTFTMQVTPLATWVKWAVYTLVVFTILVGIWLCLQGMHLIVFRKPAQQWA